MFGIGKRMGERILAIGVSEMPHRKKLCLVVGDGNKRTKYATFNNTEAAYEFMDLLCDFVGVERIERFGENGRWRRKCD